VRVGGWEPVCRHRGKLVSVYGEGKGLPYVGFFGKDLWSEEIEELPV
jgi:hypothetical protein